MPYLRDLKLINLINNLLKSNKLMQEYSEEITEAIINHRFSMSLVIALKRFQDIGLFSGDLAKLNFIKAIRLQRPEEISEAMGFFVKTFTDIKETEHAKCIQAYFNQIIRHDHSWFTTKTIYSSDDRLLRDHKIADWLDIGKAFKCLYFKTDLLKGPYSRSNFSKLLTFEISEIGSIIYNLQKFTDLLIGPDAQSNFDLLVNHHDVVSLLDALLLLVFWTPSGSKEGLLKGPFAQANFEAILHKDHLAEALPRIYTMFNAHIDAVEAQRLFDEEMRLSTAPDVHPHFVYKGRFFSDGPGSRVTTNLSERTEDAQRKPIFVT